MATITLEIQTELARLVRDVIARAVDDGEAAFTANPDGFTCTPADCGVNELRWFTALIDARLTEVDAARAQATARAWLRTQALERDPNVDQTKMVLSIEPSYGGGVSWFFRGFDGALRGIDGAYNGGNLARSVSAAFIAAKQHAIDRGLTIVEARSDLPNARDLATMYEIPFAPLTPDEHQALKGADAPASNPNFDASSAVSTECDECGESIPDDEPSMVNAHHDESCSLHSHNTVKS